ncbi:MAG: mannitol dehydrogenase family protein [Pseudomonadota bacterium]
MTRRVLHLGLGAFHRAHQAPYIQDAGGWEITAVSMRTPRLARQLAAQGHRYTLITRASDGPKLAPIDVITRTIALNADRASVVESIADPNTHAITLTVTEKGYGPDLAHLLCDGLSARQAAWAGPMTLLSCDNLPSNGDALRRLVTSAAPAPLAAWMDAACAFPSSMVDRITPAPSETTIVDAGGDLCAVETEPFRQWVIEDRFAGPVPDWASAGAILVRDVTPYEAMKLRMLNGAHSLIAYLGALRDHECVRDAMADPMIAAEVRTHMDAAAQTLPPVPKIDLRTYADDLIDRFANPAIAHRCLQIAMDGSQKLPQRIFAPARVALDRSQALDPFALAIAAWVIFTKGHSLSGAPLPLDDPLAPLLRTATAAKDAAERLDNLGRLEGLQDDGMLLEPAFRAAIMRAEARLMTKD